MQSRIRYLIKHTECDMYLNRMANDVIPSMFSALWFSTEEEAAHWMQGNYAPKDQGNYEIVETIQIAQEVSEDEQQYGTLREG